MDEKIECPHCKKLFSKYGIKNHIALKHTKEGQERLKNKCNLSNRGWSKGLTKDTDLRVKQIGEKISKSIAGENNPFYGKHHNKKTRESISKSMILAHAEGRANNWQDSKKYDNSSYPEIFFEQVIQNEFEDKNFTREFRVGQYAIDFAWVDKKLAIEIDGSQHEHDEHKVRDKRKDMLLNQLDWKVLRIKWKDLFSNTREYIDIASKFVHNQKN